MVNPERRFYFTLASRLGMTVRELLSRVTSMEITEWMAIFQIEKSEREHAQKTAKMRRRLV